MKSMVWDIWLYCNYNCDFCISKTNIIPENIRSLPEIEKAWQCVYNRYGKCKIYITGGEPFLYPDFIDIINKISIYHDLYITTNLSFDIDIIRNIKVKNNLFVNATFHPSYQSLDDFISKIYFLKQKCFVSVIYMSYDLQMSEVINYKKVFELNNIDFTVTSVSCNHNYNCIVSKYIQRGIFISEGNDIGESIEERSCIAGKEYICVDSNGDASPCNTNRNKIGNLFDCGELFLDSDINCSKKCILSENNL